MFQKVTDFTDTHGQQF